MIWTLLAPAPETAHRCVQRFRAGQGPMDWKPGSRRQLVGWRSYGYLLVFFCGALGVGPWGCAPAPSEPGVLQIGFYAKQRGRLRVLGARDWVDRSIVELIVDGGYNKEWTGGRFEAVPRLFEDLLHDGAAYYVQLAKGRRFHAIPSFPGRLVEVEDAIYSFSLSQRLGILDDCSAGRLLQSVRPSDRVGWDIVFTFSEDPGMDAFVRLAEAKIVPRPPEGIAAKSWLDRLERWPVGSGPYRVVEPGETLLLEAVGKLGSRPRHRRIRIRFSERLERLRTDLLEARISILAGIGAPDLFDPPANRPTLRHGTFPIDGQIALALNTKRKPFSRISARRALGGIVDPLALARSLLPEPEKNVAVGPFPVRYLEARLDMVLRPPASQVLDPEDSEALKGDLTLIWRERARDKRLMELVANGVAEQIRRGSKGRAWIGTRHGLPPAAFRRRLREGRFDLSLVWLDLEKVPVVFLPGSLVENYTGLREKGIERLVLRWDRAGDKDERRAIVRALTRRLKATGAWIFLFSGPRRVYFDTREVRGPPVGVVDLMRSVETW